jgi:hypothetical protein
MPILEAAPKKRKYLKKRGPQTERAKPKRQVITKKLTNRQKLRQSKKEIHQADFLKRQRELLEKYELNNAALWSHPTTSDQNSLKELFESEINLSYQVSKRASNSNAVNCDDFLELQTSDNTLESLIDILEEKKVSNDENISQSAITCKPEAMPKVIETVQVDEIERNLMNLHNGNKINVLRIEKLPNICAPEVMSEHKTHEMSYYIPRVLDDKLKSNSDTEKEKCSALRSVEKQNRDQNGECSAQVVQEFQRPGDSNVFIPQKSSHHAYKNSKFVMNDHNKVLLRPLSVDAPLKLKVFKRSLSLSRKNEENQPGSAKNPKLLSPNRIDELPGSEKEDINEKHDPLSEILLTMHDKIVTVGTSSVIRDMRINKKSSSVTASQKSTEPEMIHRQTSDSVTCCKKISITKLMPWINVKQYSSQVPHSKYEICSLKLLLKNSLVALFKCMEPECSFATNNNEFFNNHLYHHEKEKSLRKNRDKLHFQCSYCLFSSSGFKTLVHHINGVHSLDLYQCGNCFFRCREIETCYQHALNYHSELPKTIFKCAGTELEESKVFTRLRRKREEFVVSIKCKSKCNKSNFILFFVFF